MRRRGWASHCVIAGVLVAAKTPPGKPPGNRAELQVPSPQPAWGSFEMNKTPTSLLRIRCRLKIYFLQLCFLFGFNDVCNFQLEPMVSVSKRCCISVDIPAIAPRRLPVGSGQQALDNCPPWDHQEVS